MRRRCAGKKGAYHSYLAELSGSYGGSPKTELGKRLYAQRKETIERVFADANENHAMGYTHHRGLAAVTRWVRLKYVAMNLKKLALRSGRAALSPRFFTFLFLFYAKTLAFSF